MGVNSLPKTVIRQRRDCDLNPGPSALSVKHANHSATEPPDWVYLHAIKSFQSALCSVKVALSPRVSFVSTC